MSVDQDAAAFDAAVRRVLPALNLDPATFTTPPGFVARVLRFGQPRLLTLQGQQVQAVLVHVGIQPGAPDSAWPAALARALAVLPAAARHGSGGLVVAWSDASGSAQAAAFAGAGLDPAAHQPLGSSWQAPAQWARPTIDTAHLPAQALADAQAQLARAVHAGEVAAAETAWTLLGQALQRLGGEPLASTGGPPAAAHADERERWLAHVDRAVADELRRIGLVPAPSPTPPAAGAPEAPRAFISYARPDAAALAWPLRDALLAAGAQVWLDQEQPPSADTLNSGLADTIAGCDVYVMGASDEFFERAGYAMQELAWALALADAGRLGIVVVAQHADTPLPRALRDWPRVDWDRLPPAQRPARLAAALATARALRQARALASAPPRPLPPSQPPARWPRWPRRLDPTRALLRARHAERLHALGALDDPTALDDSQRARLAAHAQGLGWSGRLADIGAGQADALVRALRWRMGALAAVLGLYQPLTPDHDAAALADDLAQLIDHRLPLARWPAAIGWSAAELRLLLRWHAGLLRLLEELLQRGLWLGLPSLDAATDARWLRRVRQRRVETLDALLAQRQAGALGWAGEPPSWDQVCMAIRRLLEHDAAGWAPACPASLAFKLLQHRHALAAAVADLAWMAARRPGPLRTRLALAAADGGLDVRLFAAAARPRAAPGGIVLGIEASPGGGLRLALGWGAAFAEGAGAGWACCPWPAQAGHWNLASA